MNAFGAAGAGGGGVTLAGQPGASAAGGAEMFGGNGGNGITYDISGEDIDYGAGGGGTSSGAATNYAGTGGSPYTANSNSFSEEEMLRIMESVYLAPLMDPVEELVV